MRNVLMAGVSLLCVAFLFQNCSGSAVAFGEAEAASKNNDGHGDFGTGGSEYSCVSGQTLKIYMDPLSTGVIELENYMGAIVSYEGADDAATNYGYYSASAHPNVGPAPVGFEGNIFFYDGADGLTLNFFSNIDNGGSQDNKLDADISVEGNTIDDQVILSDDGGEIKKVGANLYEGRFHYWNNTDGGVVGPFAKDAPFKIGFKFLATGDVQSARFYSANSFHFSLSSTVAPVQSFIIANESYLNCD